MKGEESLQVSVGSKGWFLLRSHSTLEMDGLLTPAFLPDVGQSEGDADGDAQRCSVLGVFSENQDACSDYLETRTRHSGVRVKTVALLASKSIPEMGSLPHGVYHPPPPPSASVWWSNSGHHMALLI